MTGRRTVGSPSSPASTAWWPIGMASVLISAALVNPMNAGARVSAPVRGSSINTASYEPQNQGPYVVSTLDSLAGADWHRVAGRPPNLTAHVDGHDQFAAAWLSDMKTALKGLSFGVFKQSMPVPGFAGTPPSRDGTNLIVSVPGAVHPTEAVVVGSHYDGEPFSKGSAFDDASGSVIMLGLARSLGQYWRTHGLPAVTVEFCLFDAEEQGLIGSGAYLYFLRHKAILPKPIMMIDEEQSGIGYPARPFGLLSNAPMPAFAITTVQDSFVRQLFPPMTKPSPQALAVMRTRLIANRASTFQMLNALYPSLSLRSGTDIGPFKHKLESNVVVGPTSVCCSDNAPFEALGLPTVTFVGDFHYYDRQHADWSYPYDQPEDTPAAMACDTGGAPTPSTALQAALDMPVVMSYLAVNQYAPAKQAASTPVAILSTQAAAGKPVRFSATTNWSATWSFGDGFAASGATATHTYARAGSYNVRVRTGHTVATRLLTVASSITPPHYWLKPPTPPRIVPWKPRELAGIRGCP